MDNQLIYANDLATAAETAGTNLVNALQEFPSVLSNAMSKAASGDDAVPEELRADPSEVLLSEDGTAASVRDAMETIARDISPLMAAA
jgi:hypothetical protein